jgi:uncharacterized membrane protein HdeD (DUF308 family)
VKIGVGIRALVSLGVGIFITFNQDHSARSGLIALAIFGIGLVISGAVEAFADRESSSVEILPLATLALIIGSLAIFVTSEAELGFKLLVSTWGILAGAFELYLARRNGFRTQLGRDYLISSIMALALGALFMVAPLDTVSMVGFFGAYAVMSGVHLGISATTVAK